MISSEAHSSLPLEECLTEETYISPRSNVLVPWKVFSHPFPQSFPTHLQVLSHGREVPVLALSAPQNEERRGFGGLASSPKCLGSRGHVSVLHSPLPTPRPAVLLLGDLAQDVVSSAQLDGIRPGASWRLIQPCWGRVPGPAAGWNFHCCVSLFPVS